jgi:hypothetical protein
MAFNIKTLAHGGETYRDREVLGHKALAFAFDGLTSLQEDRETAAADIISDVLTALFGPAGITQAGAFGVTYDADAIGNAEALLDRALRSYHGDAEDYIAE